MRTNLDQLTKRTIDLIKVSVYEMSSIIKLNKYAAHNKIKLNKYNNEKENIVLLWWVMNKRL